MTQAAQRNGAAYRKGSIEAGGFRIPYVDGGHGSPVLLLDGVGALRPSRFCDLLTQHNRVITLDLSGLGESPENARSLHIRDVGHVVAVAAERLGLTRYGMVASSINARIALWLSLDAAEHVESLVLVSPAAILPESRDGPPLLGEGRDHQLESRLGQVETPVLVVFGTNDEVIPPETGRLYKEQMPNSYLVYVYDAGHEIAAQRPEALAGVVSDFLERRETFIVSRTNTMINP